MTGYPYLFLGRSTLPRQFISLKSCHLTSQKVAWIFGIVTQKRVKAREEYLFYVSIIQKMRDV